jgi:hypothetical protein
MSFDQAVSYQLSAFSQELFATSRIAGWPAEFPFATTIALLGLAAES